MTFPAGQTTATVAIPITNDAIAELPEDFSAVLTIPPAASSLGVTKGAADTASITILDNDPVEVVFNPTQYTVGEGDGVVTLALTADKPASFDYTVEVLTQDGTASGNLEYYIDFCKFPLICYSGKVIFDLVGPAPSEERPFPHRNLHFAISSWLDMRLVLEPRKQFRCSICLIV